MSVEPETRVRPSNQRWQEIERLLDLALERPADERRAFLEQACPDDPALLEEVNRLLRSCERPEAWLDGQAPPTRRRWWAKPRRAEAHRSGPGSARTASSARRATAGWARSTSPSATSRTAAARRAQAGPRRPRAGRPPGAPLRRGAADPRLARAPPHRPAARRRHDARRPALVRHGVRRGRAHRPLLRATPAAARGAARAVPRRCATRCSTPTRTWSSTATSSPRTSWSRPTGR